MKLCRRCSTLKDESEFNKDKRNKDGLQSWCRECTIANSREYRKNKKYINQKRDIVYSLKRPCQKCGEDRLYIIQFHHIDPATKEFEVSQFRHFSLERCKTEAEKCVCLCSNCHDEFHYLYGQKPKNSVADLEEYLGIIFPQYHNIEEIKL